MTADRTAAFISNSDRHAVLQALHRQRRRIPDGIAVVGIANRKGGVGKTTVALNLASALTASGRRTVVIDADPQGSALRWAQQRQGSDPLPVVPTKITSVSGFVAEIEKIAARGVDTAVVDLPPSLSKPSLVVCLVGDLIVIPITPSPLDLWAARAAIETVMDARNLRNGACPLLTVVPSRIDDRTSRGRKLAGGLKAMGFDVGPALRERIAFRDAADRGHTIADLDERAPARREFVDLSTHLLRRLRDLDQRRPKKNVRTAHAQKAPGAGGLADAQADAPATPAPILPSPEQFDSRSGRSGAAQSASGHHLQ